MRAGKIAIIFFALILLFLYGCRPKIKSFIVLSVNREEHFIIINAGYNQGMKLGDKFEVNRYGQNILLQIAQVRKEISAADVQPQDKVNLFVPQEEINVIAR